MSWKLVREPGMVRADAPGHPQVSVELAAWLSAQIGRLDSAADGALRGAAS